MSQELSPNRQARFLHLLLILSCWMIIIEATRVLNNLFHFGGGLWPYLLAALRMTLMLLVTYGYVRFYEKQTFAVGFHFSLKKIGRSLLWAFLFFVLAGAVLMPYHLFVVQPLLKKTAETSMAAAVPEHALKPFLDRLIVFAYVVYEGVIEVLIFIGFLLDRLARRWNWPLAITVGNVAFGLWHYSYWSKGLLEGSLMVLLTIIAGTSDSLSYWKTRTTFSPAVCHTLGDLPASIRELLGIL